MLTRAFLSSARRSPAFSAYLKTLPLKENERKTILREYNELKSSSESYYNDLKTFAEVSIKSKNVVIKSKDVLIVKQDLDIATLKMQHQLYVGSLTARYVMGSLKSLV